MLEDKIYQDYLEALKSRNKLRADFLSFIRAELKNAAIARKKEKLGDTEALTVLKKQAKKLQEAKESALSSGRDSLIKDAEEELSILSGYLPEPLPEDELLAIIDEAIAAAGATSVKDMGRVIKAVLEKAGVRAEAKIVSQLVKSKLSAS